MMMENDNMMDPRSMVGMFTRGKNMYLGGNNAPGAGRPTGTTQGQQPGLMFDLETIKRRLTSNAAQYRV